MSHADIIVIGVLCQDLSVGLKNKYGEKEYPSSLGASYVKFVEDCGGKCLPIALNQSFEYYQHIVSIVHAVVLPGGGFALSLSKGYSPSGKLLLDAVTLSASQHGRVIPIFGICLGFELMGVYFGSDDKNNLDFNMLTQYRPIVSGWKQLNFPDGAVSCRLIPADQFERLKKCSLVNFLHRMCISLDTFNSRLKDEWQVLATNDLEITQTLSQNGTVTSEREMTLVAVTMMESKSKPYLGTQFHPEKAKHSSVHREKCLDISSAETTSQICVSLLKGMIRAQNNPLTFPKDDLFRLIDDFQPHDIRNDKDIQYDFVYMFKKKDLKTKLNPDRMKEENQLKINKVSNKRSYSDLSRKF